MALPFELIERGVAKRAVERAGLRMRKDIEKLHGPSPNRIAAHELASGISIL
jgi:hypothetical protein